MCAVASHSPQYAAARHRQERLDGPNDRGRRKRYDRVDQQLVDDQDQAERFYTQMVDLQVKTGTVHETGTVTFVPDDPSQPSFTGHLTERFGESVSTSNATITVADNNVLHGSDGSLGKRHILSHLTVNASGTVTSSIDTDELTR
jgi:hypothetical protein